MNRIILKHLCEDIKSTLLLSRLISIPDNIIQQHLHNEEEKTSLIDLVYRNDNTTIKLSTHESYTSIKKMLRQDWESITLDDINLLQGLNINAYTSFRGKQCNVRDHVNKFIAEDNRIMIHQLNTDYEDEDILVRFKYNGFTVIYRNDNDTPDMSYRTSKNRSRMNSYNW